MQSTSKRPGLSCWVFLRIGQKFSSDLGSEFHLVVNKRKIHSILHFFLVGRLMGSPWKATKPNSILHWRLKPWKMQWLIVVLTTALAWTGGLQQWLYTVSKPPTLFYQFRVKVLISLHWTFFCSLPFTLPLNRIRTTTVQRSPFPAERQGTQV